MQCASASNMDFGGMGRPTIDRPHWSYSQIAQFLRCPLAYYFERILKLPKPFQSGSLAFGSTVHQALAMFHRSVQAQKSFNAEQVKTAAMAAWQRTEQRTSIQYCRGEDRRKLLDLALALLELYMQQPLPECIVAVEEPLLVPLFNSRGEVLQKPLLAIPDLLSRHNGRLYVTEFKTSGRRYSESQTDSSLQASCYAHAVEDRFNERPEVRYTVLVKTKTPQIQHLETIRNHADLTRLGDIVEVVERAIDAGAFYPVESPMNCSGCPFFKPCKQWNGFRMSEGSLVEQNALEPATC